MFSLDSETDKAEKRNDEDGCQKDDHFIEYLRFLNSTLRHDISNILTRIYLFAELLEDEYDPRIVKNKGERSKRNYACKKNEGPRIFCK